MPQPKTTTRRKSAAKPASARKGGARKTTAGRKSAGSSGRKPAACISTIDSLKALTTCERSSALCAVVRKIGKPSWICTPRRRIW